MSDCLFCKIIDGVIDAELVADEPDWIAIRDINPQAPAHTLVIPRQHVGSLEGLGRASRDLAGELMLACRRIARDEGLSDSGYRVVINTKDDGGQTVPHLHLHVLGGRFMGWPPG